MHEFSLREPTEDDWGAILQVANRSVAYVPGAGLQDEWLHNRRNFDHGRGTQRHFVAESDSVLQGYVAVESGAGPHGRSFRLFVVAAPEHRAAIAPQLFAKAFAVLEELGATDAWFIEYAADEPFLTLIRQQGFTETRRFALPSGTLCVVLTKMLAGSRQET